MSSSERSLKAQIPTSSGVVSLTYPYNMTARDVLKVARVMMKVVLRGN